METISAIILVLSTALPLLGAMLTLISKFAKSHKAKKVLEDLTLINAAILGFMMDAERDKGLSGLEKKNFVMNRIKSFAEGNRILFDACQASQTIEDLIDFSKNIN